MRLLVLGGTVFLGHEVAAQAVAAGHEVTCVARGVSGTVPDGVRLIAANRDTPDGLSALSGESFDAVIDVARRPSHVRHALAQLGDRVGHWVYVSSCSVYADHSVPGRTPADTPLLPPATPEQDDAAGENYGPAKVACEQALVEAVGPDRVFLCRAGLIVGPGDRFNRFDYWVSRLARGGEVLAPGAPDESAQWVDVRDLAAWLLRAAEQRLAGAYDGIGAPLARGDFFAGIAAALGTSPELTWADQEFLLGQGVSEWMGPRSLPMWASLPEYAGFMTRDVSGSLAAGLITRPLADTVRDTYAWLPDAGDRTRASGIDPADEAALLAAFHAAHPRP
ncbi:NAD-dependent epimerase/dehydratase family protein [Catellatospora tritici]|uniref:NAD-dependent epimerase/dehydratase family protein n=1 Tax=Catellatospora tritici TaxID=2851566 RepID=UPI001C2D555F|nr:NAD-dependent epimerase/dehydratase family protein [Catellatospora tritici]MBV1854256.1 NAD-dependent epimerase/dehydratase family protein [Catellatospora tritici]